MHPFIPVLKTYLYGVRGKYNLFKSCGGCTENIPPFYYSMDGAFTLLNFLLFLEIPQFLSSLLEGLPLFWETEANLRCS